MKELKNDERKGWRANPPFFLYEKLHLFRENHPQSISPLFSFLLKKNDQATIVYNEIVAEEYGKFDQCNFSDNPELVLDILSKADKEAMPDVLFLDINMPRIDGWEFLDELKNRNIHIPFIVMLSTSMNINDKKRAENHPLVSHFQSKPIEVDFLVELEKRVLKNNVNTAPN